MSESIDNERNRLLVRLVAMIVNDIVRTRDSSHALEELEGSQEFTMALLLQFEKAGLFVSSAELSCVGEVWPRNAWHDISDSKLKL
jgi:hypothetical protein